MRDVSANKIAMNKKFLATLWLLLCTAFASSAGAAEAGYPLDRARIDPNDVVSLQAGARTFVNYCLNCHGAQYMRYNRLTDIGLTEAQIKDNLMPVGEKVGDTMRSALQAKDGKAWFGVAPPDLSVIARSRSADWLYTYLRTFYRDPKSATGWNNAVFPNVAMPHALWTLQGERSYGPAPKAEGEAKAGGEAKGEAKAEGHAAGPENVWTVVSEGSQSTVEFDHTARDLVNFLVFTAEPDASLRKRIGIAVLFVLGVLFVLAYGLKHAYWRDVK
jgi:ubiquinol-cytochrome c reductase cytochrome c1 subunit